MAIAVVLRLVEQALEADRLVGEAEIVATGERRVVRDAAELLAFLRGPATARSGERGGGSDAGPASTDDADR